MSQRDYLVGRVRLVQEMLKSDLNEACYADYVLILCAVMSACAARTWNGTGIDRKRFVELLVRNSTNDHHITWICMPALINAGHLKQADVNANWNNHCDRIYTDEEIDMELSVAELKFPQVERKVLKKHSYASLIYEWLRCGYAHEYMPSGSITEYPPYHGNARLSYIRRLELNSAKAITSSHLRIGFHLDYLLELAEYHATNLAVSSAAVPPIWWIDG